MDGNEFRYIGKMTKGPIGSLTLCHNYQTKATSS
ncbi:hypothetical protein BH09BAC4_BH09BAC4_06310 [soil metagenome]